MVENAFIFVYTKLMCLIFMDFLMFFLEKVLKNIKINFKI